MEWFGLKIVQVFVLEVFPSKFGELSIEFPKDNGEFSFISPVENSQLRWGCT